MKKIFTAALMITAVLGLAGCGAGASQPAASEAAATTAASAESAAADAAAPEAGEEKAEAEDKGETGGEIVTANPGKLTIGTSPDFAPYEFYHIDEDGTPVLVGFDIAMSRKIAEELGLELEVVPMSFDNILLEVQNGSIDMGVSGFSPSPERKEQFDFSELYYLGGQAFVIREADKDKYTSYDDFNKGKLPVGAQTGSIQMGLAETNTPDADIVGLDKVTDIINEILNGKLEGAFIEKDVALQYQKNYPELYLMCDVEYDSEGSAIALKKGNQQLLDAVNGVIKKIVDDGTMAGYVAEAQGLAEDQENVYEGQLDEEGNKIE